MTAELPFTPDQERETWTGQYPPFDVHGIYPWSTLDTRTTEWRARRKYWDGVMPDDGTSGRDNTLYAHGKSGYHTSINGGRSRFDPVLTELMLTWYAGAGSHVYDPFAGGITRGYVANALGHSYEGVDINPAQIAHNQTHNPTGKYTVGDGAFYHPETPADVVLTCPPYHTVEKYTDDPRDLSNMTWDTHLDAVRLALLNCHAALKEDRYLVWVVGDLRDNQGHLRMLPHHTARIMQETGFRLVNEHIIINPVGTRHRMLRRWWSPTRSAGRLHQHVLVAVKGNRRRAADNARRMEHC